MSTLCWFCLIFDVFVTLTTGQEWSWIEGQQMADVPASYVYPGGRSGSSIWRDLNGDVWMFGGQGMSDTGHGHPMLLNDLWKYNIKLGKWLLLHPGTTTSSSSAATALSPEPRQLSASCGVTNTTFVVYGGLSAGDQALSDTWVFFVEKNHWIDLSKVTNLTVWSSNETIASPSARGDITCWCLLDKMFIFGGIDSNNSISSDLWRFSLKDLVWTEMRNVENVANKLVNGESRNYPRGRNGATSWVVGNTTLYMFGGNVQSTNIRSRHLNIGYSSDLWHYDIANNTWKYITGYTNSCLPGVYGRYQKRDPSNIPGCRRRAASWADLHGNLWMFGGDGTDTDFATVFHTAKLLSDLWHYEVDNGVWIWFGGSNKGESDPNYMQKGKVSTAGLPGGRCDSMTWEGPHYKFYLFGGVGHDGMKHDGYLNDLWVLDLTNVVGPTKGVAGGLLIFFIMLAVSLVLAMFVISLYARDKHSLTSLRSLHFDTKYSKLSDVVE